MVVYLASISFLAILADRDRALQYLHTDIVDAVVLEIQDCAAVNVDDYQEHLASSQRLWIRRHNPQCSWLLHALIKSNQQLNVITRRDDEVLLRIEPAGRDLMFVRSRADRFLG